MTLWIRNPSSLTVTIAILLCLVLLRPAAGERPDPVVGYLQSARPGQMTGPGATSNRAPTVTLPSRWDWREHNGVTAAQNFFPCNATWCFSAIAAVEALLLIETGLEHDLSEQQILACATPGAGCSGGWMEQAYRFIRDHGVTSEECFPYTALESTPCNAFDCTPVATITNWIDVPDDIESLKRAVLNNPVSSVILTPYEFPFYDGSYCIEDLPSSDIYAAVLIVGWDDALCSGGAWICKANNGPDWGDGGFFTIGYGEHGIGLHAQRPISSAGDGVRIAVENVFDGLTYGDDDSFPEPDETFLVYLRIRNDWLAPARNQLNSQVTVLDGPVSLPPVSIDFGALPPGGVSTSGTEIPVSVRTTAIPGQVFRLRIETSDLGIPIDVDTLQFDIGEKTVLLVDDDESERLQEWYTASLARLDYPFAIWEESHRGPIDNFEMLRYPAVIWMTGVLGRIDLANITAMTRFVTNGGHLFISGQDIGWWLNEGVGDQTSINFYERVLHAGYLADDSGYQTVRGVPGSALGQNLAFSLGGPGGSGRQDFPSLVTPLDGATVPLEYDAGLAAAVQVDGAERLLYCAFGLEAVDQQVARDTLMSRALGWLAGPPPDQRPPKIVLVEPAAGAIIPAGSQQTIRWHSEDDRALMYFLIERSFDSGVTWPQQLGFAEPDANRFLWTLDDSLGSHNRIRITAFDTGGLARRAITPGDFTVVAPARRPDPTAASVQLLGASPNPFNATTWIRFVVAVPTELATLSIFDPRGRLVTHLQAGPFSAGIGSIGWDGRDQAGHSVASGTYHYVLELAGGRARGNVTIVK